MNYTCKLRVIITPSLVLQLESPLLEDFQVGLNLISNYQSCPLVLPIGQIVRLLHNLIQ